MKFVNLTKHTVNIFDENEQEILAVKPSGQEARIKTEAQKILESNGVPLFETTVLGQPYLVDTNGTESPDFPPQQEGVIYIVSGIFRASFDREDLYQPGRLLRNEKGQPTGCVGLSR